MARRYVKTDFVSSDSVTYTFELWDLTGTGADRDYVIDLDAEGFSVDWKSGGGDYSPLVSSTLSATMFLNEEQRGEIMPLIYSEDEFRVGVKVLRGGAMWWSGIVHAEQCTEEVTDCTIAVQLGASDGLGMLEHVDWKDAAGDYYTGFMTAREVIWEAFKKLPHYPLFAVTAQIGMVEWPLMKPITDATTDFQYLGTDTLYRGTLDVLNVAPTTFYQTRYDERLKLYGTEFFNKYRFKPIEFEPCKKVIEDILISLGASMSYANGAWHVWDWSHKMTVDDASVDIVVSTVTSGGSLEQFKTAGSRVVEQGNREFKKGAVRRGVYAFSGATHEHVNAGSDLILTKGKPRDIAPLILNELGSNNDWSPSVGGVTSLFPDPSQGDLGYWNTMTGDRQDLEWAALESEIRIKFGGKMDYTNILNKDASIARCRIECYNGTNWYRLSRPVRSLYFTSQSTSGSPVTQVCTINDGGDTALWVPKFWAGAYEWVIDTDPTYADAWLEVPLGSSDESVIEGTTVAMLQTDFPNLDFFAPPGTNLENGSDNVLEKTSEEGYRNFLWRHDVTYELAGITGTVERIKMENFQLLSGTTDWVHNALYDVNGNLLPVGSHTYGSYYYESPAIGEAGVGVQPQGAEVFWLNGYELFIGDGSSEYDLRYSFYPTTQNGYEVKELPNSRLGANYTNSGQGENSRYYATVYNAPAALNENVRFISNLDGVTVENASGRLICKNYMEARGGVTQRVDGALFGPYFRDMPDPVYPYSQLKTSKLSGSDEVFSVEGCSFSLTEEEQRLELMRVSGVNGITGTEVDEQGPSKGSTPRRPPIRVSSVTRYLGERVASAEAVTDIFDLTDFTGTISVNDINNTIDLVQVTSPITDEDLGGGGGSGLLPIFMARRR